MISLAIALVGFQMKPPVPAGHELDFWIGKWSVFVGNELAGNDVVEKSLNGFVITETWHGVGGDEGTSFFYYMPAKKQWKQVWVTGIGAYKEKLSSSVGSGIRFSGIAYGPKGKQIADRTTLTPMSGGGVHQVIEQAKDGKTWKVGFDAVYLRSKD